MRERLDFQSAITNVMGHHDLALRFASGQAMETNGLSGRKSSPDVQTMDMIRLMRPLAGCSKSQGNGSPLDPQRILMHQ